MNEIENEEIEEIVIESEKRKKFNASFIASVIYFAMVFLFVLLKLFNNLGFLSNLSPIWQEILNSFLIQIIIMLSMPFVLFTIFKKQKIKQTLKDFSFKKISLASIGISIVIGIAVFILNSYIASFFSTLIGLLGAESAGSTTVNAEDYTIPMFFLTVFLSAVLPAICEEVAHRGMLVGANKRYGVAFAIIISSVCFGLLHMNIYQCFYAVLIGFLLGFICISTGSIYPCMIIHFMNNFLNTFFDFSYVNGWLGGGYYAWDIAMRNILGDFGSYMISLVIFSVSSFVLFYFTLLIIKKERLDKSMKNIDENYLQEYAQLVMGAYDKGFLNEETLAKSKDKIYLGFLIYKAQQNKTSIWEYLENPNGKLKKQWYDNIFLYTSIVLSGFFTLYSFIALLL